MNDKVNELQTKYLAKNNYFAVSTYGIVYRRDTWESYGFCGNFVRWRDIVSDADRKQWLKQAENFINQLDKPEDWQRPHRFCLARHARQILEDDNFRENLIYNKGIDDEYIYRYTIISRLKESALIKKLNLLPDEEKSSYSYFVIGKKKHTPVRMCFMLFVVVKVFMISYIIKK